MKYDMIMGFMYIFVALGSLALQFYHKDLFWLVIALLCMIISNQHFNYDRIKRLIDGNR